MSLGSRPLTKKDMFDLYGFIKKSGYQPQQMYMTPAMFGDLTRISTTTFSVATCPLCKWRMEMLGPCSWGKCGACGSKIRIEEMDAWVC